MSKSVYGHVEIIIECLNKKNYNALFYGNKKRDISKVLQILKGFDINYQKNKSLEQITFENGSKILFMDNVTEKNLTGMVFNATYITE